MTAVVQVTCFRTCERSSMSSEDVTVVQNGDISTEASDLIATGKARAHTTVDGINHWTGE